MDDHTAQRLNAINQTFYATVADAFDTTRGRAWQGWQRLPTLVCKPVRASVSVLDVGCGNARLGAFLAQTCAMPLRYHGIDSSPALLEHARAAMTAYPHVETRLDLHDIVDAPLHDGSYNLVALFGVMHHIPGASRRLALMRALAGRVAPGGLLAFACWRFYEFEKFRARVVPFPPDLQVEAGDYLLDWRRGETALRYCHYVDDDEHRALIAATGLREVVSYRADGEGGTANQYTILQKLL